MTETQEHQKLPGMYAYPEVRSHASVLDRAIVRLANRPLEHDGVQDHTPPCCAYFRDRLFAGFV